MEGSWAAKPALGEDGDSLKRKHESVDSLVPIIPNATSFHLGWVGLQALRWSDCVTNELSRPPLGYHTLVLTTRAPEQMTARYDGVKRDKSPAVGSIAVLPANSGASFWRWRGRKDSLHVFLEPKLVARVASTSFELDPGRGLVRPLDASFVPELYAAMLAVDTELSTRGTGGPLLIESLANALAVYLIRHLMNPRRLRRRADGPLSRQKLRQITEYIMENLESGLSLEQMAAIVNVSPYHFVRQFKAATGVSPHQYVIAQRVERAKEVLRTDGALTLAEVALNAGFYDQSHFCFHFKRFAGVTPAQFRASKKCFR